MNATNPGTSGADATEVIENIVSTADIDESERLLAVRSLNLLDTPPEERFDRIVRLARDIFHVPFVAVNLIDDDRQYTKATVGFRTGSVPRTASLCTYTIGSSDITEITDTLSDPAFREHPATKLGVRFYAGAPLAASTGQPVGTFCIADTEPRELSASEEQLLRGLADWVEKEMMLQDDLWHAAEVQRRLLPHRRPEGLRGLDVAGRCVPSRQVGGDFYDWQLLPDGRLQVVIADVMGKGLSAALIGAGLRAVLRGATPYNELPRVVTRVAGDVAHDLQETESFITLFAARIAPDGGLEYIDAGHGLAAAVGDTAWRQLSSSELPLGVLPDQQWTPRYDRLTPNEKLIVVSDGVLDVFPTPQDALQATVDVARHQDCEALVETITKIASSRHSTDDVTAVAVCRSGR